MAKILMIGGSPGTGKTTLAKSIAYTNNIPWISTDIIREFVYEIMPKDQIGKIGFLLDKDPVEYYNSKPPEKIAHDLYDESLDTCKFVKRFIQTNFFWNSYIIEGADIVPEIADDMDGEADFVFLGIEDRDYVRDLVYNRGVWDSADKYPYSVKDIEIEWVLNYQRMVKQGCEEKNLNYIKISHPKDLSESKEIKKVVKRFVKKVEKEDRAFTGY